MPISRRSLAVLFVFFAALLIGFALHQRQPSPAPSAAATPAFDVDQVTALTWNDHGRAQALKARDGAWPRARALIASLARVRLGQTSLPVQEDVRLELTFAEGPPWSGAYHDGTFAWTGGPRKGEGFRANEELDALFLEGDFVFRSRDWMWCSARPLRFEFEVEDRTLELRETHQGWVAKKDGVAAAVDSAAIDAWVSNHCQILIERFRDLRVHPLGLNAGGVRFVANFLGGARYELREANGLWSIGAQPFAFRSREWDEAIKELAGLVN